VTTLPESATELAQSTDYVEKSELTDYVKNTDYATSTKAGVFKTSSTYGTSVNPRSGILYIMKASEAEIDARSNYYKTIVPANLEYAVKSVTYDKAEIDGKFDALDIPEAPDLTNYYTKSETYSKTEVDNLIPEAPDLSGYYTKSETYSKTEVDDLIPEMPNLEGYYTREETYSKGEVDLAIAEASADAKIDVTAEVGQTIIAKEVDAEGKPTSWESADYLDPEEIFTDGENFLLPQIIAEVVINGSDHNAILPYFAPIVGKTYVVNYNGVDYECECIEPMEGYRSLGNMRIFGISVGTDLPFLIVSNPSDQQTMALLYDSSTTITISVKETGVKQIHESLLPIFNITNIVPETTFTASFDSNFGAYVRHGISLTNKIIAETTYTIVFDGVEYTCVGKHATLGEMSGVYAGNGVLATGINTGEPFALLTADGTTGISILCMDGNEHTVFVATKELKEQYAPKVFVATYGVTTYQEIVEAANTGRVVQALYEGALRANLAYTGEDGCVFTTMADGILVIFVDPDSNWDVQVVEIPVADELVPNSRSINGKQLYNDITLTKSDIGLGNVDNVRQYSANNPPPYPVTSVAGKTGSVTLAKTDVGLGNVDNTADKDKPLSTAQQSAINNSYDKVMSRGEQLVVNGSALLGNNTNFSSWQYDGAVANNSSGSFTRPSGQKGTLTTDDFFAINPTQTYKLSLDAKSANGLATLYAFLNFYDADKNEIKSPMHMYNSASTTTLAKELKAGDMVVYLSDISGWSTTYAFGMYALVWNYTNSNGYTYPVGTYSRTRLFFPSVNNKLDPAAIDTTNKTVQLKTAYSGATIPAGTAISQSGDGATYKYLVANQKIPSTWTTYGGTLSGVDLSGTNASEKAPPGTAYCKVGFLWNNNTAADQIWVTNVSVTSSDAIRDAAGASLGLVKTGGDVTISNGVITVSDNSHNHTIANIANLQTILNNKLNSQGLSHYSSDEGADIELDIGLGVALRSSMDEGYITLRGSGGGSSMLIDVTSIAGIQYTDILTSSLKGNANGLAELDENGKVLSSQLPSYVDDVIEVIYDESDGEFYIDDESYSVVVGESGKIYIDTGTNKSYRWSGSTFVEISSSLALGETSSSAYRGDRGKIAYDHSQKTGNPHGTKPGDIGAASATHSHSASEITSGTIAAARLPSASGTQAGITIVYPAASCTTFSSDTGTVTPLAVQKGAKHFAITRPTNTTANTIVRYSNTTGDVKTSKILVEDVTNTADTSKTANVISVPAEGGKKMVYGYCTDQIDGTAFIGGLFDASATKFPYSAGLAIGGSSGNLLWKGVRVATANDLPKVATTSAAGLMSAADKIKLDNIDAIIDEKLGVIENGAY
jgi:hypothetical protein